MRGDGFVYQRGGRWWARYRAGGEDIRRPATVLAKAGQLRPAKSEQEALRFLKARIGEVRGGHHLTTAAARLTVADLLDAIELRAETKGLRSFKKIKCHAKPLRRAFGLQHAVDLSSVAVARYTAQRRKDGRAPATVNRELEVLVRAYRQAVRDKLLTADRMPAIEYLAVDNARSGFLEPAEVAALLAQVGDQDLKDFIEWAYATGMRKGEAASLTWDMLRRTADPWTLEVPGAVTKNAKARSIGIGGTARAVIERRLKRQRLDCPFIFHRTSKGRVGVPIKALDKAWRSALVAAKLPAGLLFHDLRRSAVRNLIRAGVDQQTAMLVSGHKTATMFRRYNILTAEQTAAALVQVDTWRETQPQARNVAEFHQPNEIAHKMRTIEGGRIR
ncbi:MAG TPA: site-specific integrase [Vicinamibacteria bacterium]|nr:site-specific integrase [Vicinamibacteria bacterium]